MRRRRRFVNEMLLAACFALIVATIGCSDRSGGKTASGKPTETVPKNVPNEAEKLLERMIAAYQKADSYADRGELRIDYRREGRPFEVKVPFALALQRPSKLQMHYYQGHVVGDGKNLWGWTEDLPGYLWKRPVSAALTLGDLSADAVLWSVLSEGQAGGSLQLNMLIGADSMQLMRAGGERPELQSDEVLDGRNYHRVRVRRGDGNLVYWIDAETLVLRRIEFPTKNLALTLAEATKPADVTMTADFHDPQLNPTIDPQAFQFEPPAGVQIVDKLDSDLALPPPPPLVQTLGTKLGDFQLASLDGKPITRGELAGKTTVLLFWSLGSSECLPVLGRLNKLYASFRSRPDVRFLAVSLDAGPSDAAIADVRELLATHGIEVPAARITTQDALNAFDVRFVPNLYVIGPDGTVQDSEVGANPKLEETLPARIDRVAKGESLVAETRARHDEWLKKYEQAQQSRGAQGAAATSLPQANLAPASEPKKLKMKRVWKSTDVKEPGFILATDAKAGPAQIIVADGLRAVAELDSQGKLVKRVELDLPKEPIEAVVSFWRTAIDKQGKRVFVGSASAQQQLHLFDRDFKKLLSYPEGTHAGISDVQVADLDGDGEPEINVGYWEVVGLQNLGLDGVRRWANRRLPENILRLAATHLDSRGKRLLLCATGVGSVAVIDELGQTLKEMPIGNRAVRLIAVDDLDGDGGIEMCAMATTGPGTDVAVGFDAVGKELWHYQLPPGVHTVPTLQNECIAVGKLVADESAVWIFAAADGTIHLVDHYGLPVDVIGWGEAIHGLAVGPLDGVPTLFVSDAKSVTALQFTR